MSASGGSDGQVLTKDSGATGGLSWQTQAVVSATPSGSAGGALSGTYPNPSLSNDAVTPAKLSSDTPATGELLSYNGTGFEWVVASSAPIASVNAKTGTVVLDKTDIGLADVDNTSDANKPVSTAAQSALDDKADTSSLAAVATSGDYSDLTNQPAVPAQFNPLAGTNVTLTGTYPNITFSAAPSAGVTDLSSTRTGADITVISSTGNDAVLDAATGTDAGVMSAIDKTKLDNVASGATANSTDTQLRDRTSHTGVQAIATVTGLQATLDDKLSLSGGTMTGNLAAPNMDGIISLQVGDPVPVGTPAGTTIVRYTP